MKKRILSLILTAVLLLTCIPIVMTTTVVADSITIADLTYKSARTQRSKSNYNQRTWDNSSLSEGNASLISSGVDSDKGGSVFKAYSRSVASYYPAYYLNGSNQFARDTTYDGQEVDVDLATYLESGTGKYYGYFKVKFSSSQSLQTFRIYNRTSSYHLNSAFDVFYGTDGSTWTKRASYTGMTDQSKWHGKETVDGQECVYIDIDMCGVTAQYIAIAINGPTVQNTCCLWHATATSGTGKTISARNEQEFRDAIPYGSRFTGVTVNLLNDFVSTNAANNYGSVTGTNMVVDGQNHKIYNLRKSVFGSVSGTGITIKNLTVSNKTSSSGSVMTGVRYTFNILGTVSGGTSANPITIQNVNNERDISMGDLNGNFARQVYGYAIFTGCTNSGSIFGDSGGNYKVGGLVGEVCNGANVTFTNCINSGNVGGSQVGGFVGIFHTGMTITMTNCHNSGTVTAYANGNAWGIGGGLLGQPNNGEAISTATTITLTGCTNSGDILLDSTAENTKGNSIGGMIGLAGNMSGTPTVNITLDNCGVYGCTIDAIDAGGASHGNFMAAGLIGKVSPQGNTNLTILMKNCYVSKVNIAAYSAYKFIGVGNNTTGIYPFATAENCMLHKVYRVNGSGETITWDGTNGMWDCARTFTSGVSNFADTDTSNIISGGGSSYFQTGTSGSAKKVRFAATLNSGTLETYERAGFFVVGLKSGESSTSSNVWITPTRQVYTSIKVGNTTTTAANITAGASYIFLTEIGGIPSGVGSVTFYAVPFLIEQSGRIIFGVQGSQTISN